MNEAEIAEWFVRVFRGKWVEAPAGKAIPATMLDDSKQWARVFLADSANPYNAVNQQSHQQVFLGLELAPDKLVTTFEAEKTSDKVTIFETLQHFIVSVEKTNSPKLAVKDLAGSLTRFREDFLPLLSGRASQEVSELIKNATQPGTHLKLKGKEPFLISGPGAAINAITNWFDRINLIWFEAKLYLDFYKTYPGAKVAVFQPGLDWYPPELRAELGVSR